MVEQSVSGTNSQIVYGPGGDKLALMNGGTLTKAFVPLTGGATAVYNSSGLAYYRHSDHLGSSRLSTTASQTQTPYSDIAYSPFGEPYASSGTIDSSFTGQNQDTLAGLYDFMYREHDPNQGRWTQPDPAGLAAVSPSNPQSWNRYAYALGNPMVYIDPLGLLINHCSTVENRDPNRPNQDSKVVGGPFAPGDSTEADPQYPSAGCGGGGGNGDCDPIMDPEDCGDPCAPFFGCVGIGIPPVDGGGGGEGGGGGGGGNPPQNPPQNGGGTPPNNPGTTFPGTPVGQTICVITPSQVICASSPLPPWLIALLASGGATAVAVPAAASIPSTLDNRANALAHAINQTGVQSLGNPCTVATFYGVSAAGGVIAGYAAGGEVELAINEATAPYWQRIYFWLYRQTIRGAPAYRFLSNTYGKARDVVAEGCNAMQ